MTTRTTFSRSIIGLWAFIVFFLPSCCIAPPTLAQQAKTLSQVEYSLQNRSADPWVNEVFADNILLTAHYIGALINPKEPVVWDEIRKPKAITFMLKPGETFAFHDQVLGEYQNKNLVTTKAHFNATEGFRSDGWLVGNGVCHLASFMAKAAKDAGLEVVAPTNHDFMPIPDIDPVNGVSIYSAPGNAGVSARQNLYITNSRTQTIVFIFEYTTEFLTVKIAEI